MLCSSLAVRCVYTTCALKHCSVKWVPTWAGRTCPLNDRSTEHVYLNGAAVLVSSESSTALEFVPLPTWAQGGKSFSSDRTMYRPYRSKNTFDSLPTVSGCVS